MLTGRRSLTINFGVLVFGTAIAFACFQLAGKTASPNDEVKVKHSGLHSAKAVSRKNQFGKPSVWSKSLANVDSFKFSKNVVWTDSTIKFAWLIP